MFLPNRFDAGACRWLLIYAALPLAYVICGRLGLVLAVPPGYATAVFLPAGIAVAAMFMAGAATLPATFLGSLLLNIWIGYTIGGHIGIVSIAAAVVIALASMLQAAIGGTVLRRSIGYPAGLDNPRDLLLFLLLSPIFCLTSVTLSLGGMWALGTVQSTELLINWMTWWVGDTLGVLVALPLMLVVAGEPRSLWRSRTIFVAVPMVLCFGLFVAIFIRVNSWENDQSLLEFRLRSQQLADTMQAMLDEQLGFLDQLSNVFVGRHQPASRQNFHDLVQPLLQRFSTVQAVEWAPQVRSADRASFEAAQRIELAGFLIRQRAGSGELRSADDRSQFYPVTYLEPFAGNESAVGFDLLSDPTRRVAIETTISSGKATATAPIRLVQERSEQSGILLTRAVPGGPTGPGIVLLVLRMGTFTSTVAGPFKSTLNLRFVDTAAGPPFFDDMSQSAATSYETGFNFGGRHYVVTTMPTSEYLARHRGWESWAVLAAGVLGTGLLGALLMLGTGHTYRIERLATQLRETATIVEASRDAIWSWAIDGTITSWNAEAGRMLGYTADEILGKPIMTLIPPDRIEAAHDIISKVSRGQVYAPWETIRLRKNGTSVQVELTVSPIRSSEGRVTGAATVCRDITARKRAEARIAADLRDMTRLNELSNKLVREGAEIGENLAAALDTAIALAGTDKGNLQLFNSETGALTIAAQRGFDGPFLKFFEYVRDDASACATAMRSGERMIVEDVASSEIFAKQASKDVLMDAGVRAVISTPLMSSTGNLLGRISTHFGEPHHPEERELRLLDLFARQIADYLERKRAEEIENTLVREIQHRSNNLLAVIQTIASRSLSGNYSLAEAKAAFDARLHALARANRQLTNTNWSGVSLTEIVRSELQPFAGRIVVEGINVTLSPRHAQNFSLALHELATNAAKYGALSNGSGKVEVSWALIGQAKTNALRFIWRETGGPPVARPAEYGFGTTLLKATFPDARIDYATEGLCCQIDIVLSSGDQPDQSGAS